MKYESYPAEKKQTNKNNTSITLMRIKIMTKINTRKKMLMKMIKTTMNDIGEKGRH